MNSHKHARLTPKGRALLVNRVQQQGWTVRAASEAGGVSVRTAYKWLARFKTEGAQGLADRSSRPRRCPHAITEEDQARFEALRRQRWPLWRIAMQAGRSLATLSRCMKQAGLSRLKSLEPVVPVVRYERAAPGELLHIDTKKLGRIKGIGHRITGDRTLNRNQGIGWDAVHLAIDDHSRVSFAAIKSDETSASCTQFLREAVASYAQLGVRIDRVMTDNGAGYKKIFDAVCDELGIRHIRTRPYTPKTKAWTSYCTLCGWLSGDEASSLTSVAAADAADELTTIGRLVQAAEVVAVEVALQHPFAPELMDGGR
jgi:transposase